MSAAEQPAIDPTRVRAAVFDLGGVLLEGGPSEVIAFGSRLGLARETWNTLRREIFGNDGVWARLERGECSYAEFLSALQDRLRQAGVDVDLDEAATFLGARDPMARTSALRTRMIDAVRRLREVLPTALLTNNVREWRDAWRGLLEIDQLFDVVVDSSEVGARKPETRVYEITRERLGVRHDEIFFVDDIGQNLKAARSLGWQTYLFVDEENALRTLDDIRRAVTEPRRGASR